MVNLHTDQLRRRRFETVAQPPDLPLDDATADILEQAELAQALAVLPSRERQCVVLRHHAGLSEAEVADLLGCGIGTVKSSTSRGLTRLRSVLSREGGSHV